MNNDPTFIETLGAELRAGATRLEQRRARRRRLAGVAAVLVGVGAVGVWTLTGDDAPPSDVSTTTPSEPEETSSSTTTAPTESEESGPDSPSAPDPTDDDPFADWAPPDPPLEVGEIRIDPVGPYADGQQVELLVRNDIALDTYNSPVMLCARVDGADETCDPGWLPVSRRPFAIAETQGIVVTLAQRHLGVGGENDCADATVVCRLLWRAEDGTLLSSDELAYDGPAEPSGVDFTATPTGEPGVVMVEIDGLGSEPPSGRELPAVLQERIAAAVEPMTTYDPDAVTVTWQVSSLCSLESGDPPIGAADLGIADWWQLSTLRPDEIGSRGFGPNCQWLGEDTVVIDGSRSIDVDRSFFGFGGWSDCGIDACFLELTMRWFHPEPQGGRIGGDTTIARVPISLPAEWPAVQPAVTIVEEGPFVEGDTVTVETRGLGPDERRAISFCRDTFWDCTYVSAEIDADVSRITYTVPSGCDGGRCYFGVPTLSEGLPPSSIAVIPIASGAGSG